MGSGHRHLGLQPSALPSELPRHMCGESRVEKLQSDPAEHDVLRPFNMTLARPALLGICLGTTLAKILERHLSLREHCGCLLTKICALAT